jgi:hypothetical protein
MSNHQTTAPAESRQENEMNAPALAEDKEIKTYSSGTGQLVLDSGSFERIMEFAGMMAKGVATVPKHLHGNTSDCAAVVMQAMQWKMNPYAVAQKTHLVNGVLGYEAQLVNAVIQASGFIEGYFLYEYEGDGENLSCRVGARVRGDASITWGQWLTSKSVTTKNSPLWKTNPKQQLGYLQVKNWSRLYCPGAILGVYTNDELEEIKPIGGSSMRPSDLGQSALNDAQNKMAEGITDEQKEMLVMRLELKANNGVKAFREEWALMNDAEKAAIGIPERDRINGRARQSDAATVSGDAANV